MMRLILFYIIGDCISAPTSYWIVYTLACVLWVIKFILDIAKELVDS